MTHADIVLVKQKCVRWVQAKILALSLEIEL